MPADGRLGHRVLRGVELHFLGQFAVIAANLFLTPLIVHGLGTDGYALYTFMWTLCGYLIVLNIGTSTTIQRYGAFFQGKGDFAGLSGLLRRLLALHVLVAAVGAACLLAASGPIIRHLFHTEGPVLEAAPPVLMCVALAAPFYFALQFALNSLYGLQRFGRYNFFLALQTVAMAAGAATILFFAGGLVEIAELFIAVNALLALAALWSIRDVLLTPSRAPRREERDEIVSFSLKNFVNMVLWTFLFQGDRVFIGSFLPLSQLGFYVIPASLMQKFNMFSGAVTATTFPMLAELHGRGEEERLRRLYLKASELSLFFLLPLSIIAFVLAPQFLSLWLGAEFSLWGTWPMRLLILANLAYFGAFLPNNIATSKGRPEVTTYLQAAKAAILIGGWTVLIPRYGISGAAGGTFLAEVLCAPVFIGYVHRRFLDLRWWTFFSEACYRPVIAGACLLALGLSVHAHADTWPRLILSGTAGGALYLAVGYFLLDRDAKELLSDWLRRKI